MGEKTAISWCHHTHNLWWGCWKIDPECAHCYADAFDHRLGGTHWGRTNPRRFFDDNHVNELVRWNKRAAKDGERRRVFVGSMCDWAERHIDPEVRAKQDAVRARFFEVAKGLEHLDFLMLTKRPEDAAELLPWGTSEPWPNFWIGVSAGTVPSLRTKVPVLRRMSAAVRFISGEPLLEMIDASAWDAALEGGAIHWLIIGNESGHKRREVELAAVRVAREAAARHGVTFHFKQWVEHDGSKTHLPILDGVQHAGFPEV
jgi:protein gp37